MGSSYAVGAILAISAIEKVPKNEPTIANTYAQIVPADPPFESGTRSPMIVMTHPLASMREYPNIEKKRKFLCVTGNVQSCCSVVVMCALDLTLSSWVFPSRFISF